MSGGERVSREIGLKVANKMVDLLRPECERIELAGSLRRGKATIGDIEIVLIPKDDLLDLFGEIDFGSRRIEAVLVKHNYELLKNGQYFKQTIDPSTNLKIEIYLTTPEKWGCVFTIRTGSAEFSHKLVTKRRDGGYCPSNLQFKDGRIWNGDQVLDTPEEIDVFNTLNFKWIGPELREVP